MMHTVGKVWPVDLMNYTKMLLLLRCSCRNVSDVYFYTFAFSDSGIGQLGDSLITHTVHITGTKMFYP